MVAVSRAVAHEGPATGAAPSPLPPGQRDPWGPFLRTMAGVGLNSFGGPVAQIGVMHRLAVEERRWLTESQFLHLLNFANVLPGPEALEIAIHLGWLRRGRWGGIAAGLLFVAPGFVTLTFLGWIYRRFGSVPSVAGFLAGIRPVAMALVGAAAWRIARRAATGPASYALMASALVASLIGGVPFLVILLGCGLVGVVVGRARDRAAGAASRRLAPALFLGLVALLVGWQWLHQGSAGAPALSDLAPAEAASASEAPVATLWMIGWVNLKAALLTFGGAYTVLPYLREQFVHVHGWLTDRAVMDALALGETTPGPLISVGVFLSFLAGGFGGAIAGTIFLFLPSFVLVLSLGRFIEPIENTPKAGDLLWGFSAGTLGLIVALAATLIPASLPDAPSWAIALAAFALLHRFRTSPLLLVSAGGLLGLLLHRA